MKNAHKFLFASLLLVSGIINAQIGIGTTTPVPTAVLDLTSTTQGFVPPRMTTTQRDVIASPAAGLMVYNTSINCLEVYNGTSWYNICGVSGTSNGTALVSAYASTSAAGAMTAGTGVSGVSQTITATVVTAGTYSISATANGVTFLGSGTFAGTGAQVIVLTAIGTPTSNVASPYTYTTNTAPNCSFTRVVNHASTNGTAVVTAYACATSSGVMTAGTPVSGATQTVTATVGTVGTYAISATANGVTFFGSGTFAGTGAQVITLTASGTPASATANPYAFTFNTTPSCSFNRNVFSATSNGTAVVSDYACSTASTGIMRQGTSASGFTQTLTATVVAVGTYDFSTTVNGVTFTGSGTFSAIGQQTFVLTASGTPISGTGSSYAYPLNTTPSCSFNRLVLNPNDVLSSTGKIWMDRNLGATQVATSPTDAAAYGHLYQWGRGTDGHQIRTSSTTTVTSSTDVPVNGSFIHLTANPVDWRVPQNANLWQGVNGINNPCPAGYRVPTLVELEAELTIGPSAFGSILKLTLNGFRDGSSTVSQLIGVGNNGYIWSSTVNVQLSRSVFYDGGPIFQPQNTVRANGCAVRCIRNYN